MNELITTGQLTNNLRKAGRSVNETGNEDCDQRAVSRDDYNAYESAGGPDIKASCEVRRVIYLGGPAEASEA